jgi:hypothetical protein
MGGDPAEHRGGAVLAKLSRAERAELAPRGDADLPLEPIDPATVFFDRQISRFVSDVPVPRGLRQRVMRGLERVAERKRTERQMRRWSVAMASLAASLLLAVLLQPFFGRPALDSEALAGRLDSVHQSLVEQGNALKEVTPTQAWPKVIDPTTCVGEKSVEFLGKQRPAYLLAAGADRATLLILPASQFPFQLGRPYVAVTHSALHLQAHYFAFDHQVCILIVRDGTDVRRFRRPESVT